MHKSSRRTAHWFAVVAVDQAGNALDEVTPETATPVDIVAPENPGSLTIQPFENRLILYFSPSTDSGGDLSGYRIYLDDSTEGSALSADAVSFEKIGLSPATAYDFRLTARDTDGN